MVMSWTVHDAVDFVNDLLDIRGRTMRAALSDAPMLAVCGVAECETASSMYMCLYVCVRERLHM